MVRIKLLGCDSLITYDSTVFIKHTCHLFILGQFFQDPKVVEQAFPQQAWKLVTGLDFLVYDFWTVGVNSMGQSETSDVTI